MIGDSIYISGSIHDEARWKNKTYLEIYEENQDVLKRAFSTLKASFQHPLSSASLHQDNLYSSFSQCLPKNLISPSFKEWTRKNQIISLAEC